MGELKGHWTNRNVDDFLFRIAFDFVSQLQNWMDAEGTSRADLAKKLGVSKGRVSQVLNDPGNLKLRTAVEFSRALNRKIALVAYDDHDPSNQGGPINGQVFANCWESSGRPKDMFDFHAISTATTINSFGVLFPPPYDGSTTFKTTQYSLFGRFENVAVEAEQSATDVLRAPFIRGFETHGRINTVRVQT